MPKALNPTIPPADLPAPPAPGSGVAVLAFLEGIKNWIDFLNPENVARTATSDGSTTGTIVQGTRFVTVTVTDANHIIKLPPPVVGHIVILHNGATAYKLQSTDPSNIGINGGAGSSYKSTIPASSTCVMICVGATGATAWKGFYLDADSDVAKVPAAA